jgi:hypothetical protein
VAVDLRLERIELRIAEDVPTSPDVIGWSSGCPGCSSADPGEDSLYAAGTGTEGTA